MTPIGSTWPERPAPAEVTRFLSGPQPRGVELVRAFRIFAEFMRGFRALHFVGPCVSVFGSARFSERHRYFLSERLVGEATIDPADAKRLLVTDSPAEAVAVIRDVAIKRFALTYGPRARRRWFLGE